MFLELEEEERKELIVLFSEWVLANVPGKIPADKLNVPRFMAVTAILMKLKGVKAETMTIGEEKVGGTDAD